ACAGDRGHPRGIGEVPGDDRRPATGAVSDGRSPVGVPRRARAGHRDGGIQGRGGGSPQLRHRRRDGLDRPEDELAIVRIAILAARQGWHTDELCRALAARGHEGCVLSYEALVARLGGAAPAFAAGETDLGACDAVLARIIPQGSLEQIIFRVDGLHALEEQGVPVVNSPRAIERTVDKLWTTAILAQAGLAVPETVVCESPDAALAAFRQLQDVIVKPLFGSVGLGMVRVTTEEMAFRGFCTLENIRGGYYFQGAVDHDGCDPRAFLVGGPVGGGVGGRGDDRRASPRAPDGRLSPPARAAEVAAAAQLACLLEASAPKPGNVSPLAAAGERPLGATIRAAVEATGRWVPSNTNLGLVLLLAPLARAALISSDDAATLRTAVATTLGETTVADAQEVYAAIRQARPGGLGRSPQQDVAGTPTVTLREAMALAAERDAIAREYATDFQTTFDAGAPVLRRGLAAGLSWNDAV